MNGLFSETEILILNTDQEKRVIFDYKEKTFITKLNIFDFQNFDVEKAINRIKTMLTFQ